eukprot:IDg15499t1
MRFLRAALFSLVLLFLLLRIRNQLAVFVPNNTDHETLLKIRNANSTDAVRRIVPHSPHSHRRAVWARELRTEQSGFATHARDSFPHFYTCVSAGAPAAAPDCEPTRALPNTASAPSGTHLAFIIIRALPSNAVNLYDPPLAMIGTSYPHTRLVTAGAVAELATHIAVWRETFAHGKGTPALVIAGAAPAAPRDVKWVARGVALVERDDKLDDLDTYVVSQKGANLLLARTPAFVRPLPSLLSTLMRKTKKRADNTYLCCGCTRAKMRS